MAYKFVLFKVGKAITLFLSDLTFREAGVYGRTAGKDGTLPNVRQPDAELHICSAQGLAEAHPDREVWSNLSSPSI